MSNTAQESTITMSNARVFLTVLKTIIAANVTWLLLRSAENSKRSQGDLELGTAENTQTTVMDSGQVVSHGQRKKNKKNKKKEKEKMKMMMMNNNKLASLSLVLFGIALTVPIGLINTSYQRVDGIMVPSLIFEAHPIGFVVILCSTCLSLFASAIGFVNSLPNERFNVCLSSFSLFSLIVLFYTYMWLLLPANFKILPVALIAVIGVVLLRKILSIFWKQCTNAATSAR